MDAQHLVRRSAGFKTLLIVGAGVTRLILSVNPHCTKKFEPHHLGSYEFSNRFLDFQREKPVANRRSVSRKAIASTRQNFILFP